MNIKEQHLQTLSTELSCKVLPFTNVFGTPYKSRYVVSELGDIFKYSVLKNGNCKFTKLTPQSLDGYLRVLLLTTSNKSKQVRVHRIVASTFIDSSASNQHLDVDHINHKRNDNRLSNLRIVTKKEHGLLKCESVKFHRVVAISNTDIVKTSKTITDLSRQLGISVRYLRSKLHNNKTFPFKNLNLKVYLLDNNNVVVKFKSAIDYEVTSHFVEEVGIVNTNDPRELNKHFLQSMTFNNNTFNSNYVNTYANVR